MSLHRFMNREEFTIESILSQVKEGMNSPLEVEWTKSSSEWKGTFKIENTIYKIDMINLSEKTGHWLFKFSNNGNYEMTNDLKKAFSVIPTIKNAVFQVMDELDPEIFMFFAMDSSASRKKIYNSFCEELKENYDRIFFTEKQKDQQIFIVSKKEYDGMELALSITKLTRMYTSEQ